MMLCLTGVSERRLLSVANRGNNERQREGFPVRRSEGLLLRRTLTLSPNPSPMPKPHPNPTYPNPVLVNSVGLVT